MTLRGVFRFFLGLMLVLIPTSFRFVMSEVDLERAQIFPEFRAIVIFAADLFLWLGLITAVILSLKTREALANLLETIGKTYLRPWLLLLIWAALSLSWSRYVVLALYQVYELWLVLSLALLMAALLEKEDWQFLAWSILLVAALQSLIAMLQLLNGGSLGLEWLGEIPFRGSRAYGLSVNPNNLAGFLLVAWHLGLSLWQAGKKRWLIAALLGLLLAACLATASRTVMLALLLSTMGIGFSQGRLIRWLVFFLFLAFVVAFVLPSRSDISLWQRLFFEYEPTWEVIRAYPLLGAGMGQLLLEAFRINQIDYRILLPAHNAFMVLWAELGLVGLVAYCFGYVQTIRACFKLPGRELVILAWGFIAIMLVALLDFYFWSDLRTRILFFFYLGILWNRIAAMNRNSEVPKEILPP
jgi:O-antigen ligase